MTKQEPLNFSIIILTAWHYRIAITLIPLIAAVVTFGITFLIKPKFKATAIIYSTAPTNSGKEMIGLTGYYRGVSEFGGEDEAEQLMEVVSSQGIRRRVANRINLWQHYGIDTTNNARKNYSFDNIWDNNVSLNLTRFNALHIEAYDTDPATAALVANTIAEEVDSAFRATRRERSMGAYNFLLARKKILLGEYKQLEDSLTRYRKLGLVDIAGQTKEIYRIKLQEIAANNKERTNRIEKEFSNLKNFSAHTASLEAKLFNKGTEIAKIEESETGILAEANQVISSIFNVDRAEKPEVKAYPKRAITTITAGIGAFILALFIVFAKEYLKNEVWIETSVEE
ncbi:Wzz/FepE/Etk N-terminal domain-containing protein [Williamwhitmania taraxaci]|uniref:Chain length determinant protein n=1 Tax=Williamwhitmania taraxaci TaxID=1640674 RepID=A0A1G6IB67_9BACT|nr:Wzz/FepE/Etk N-terminal domain-containing protein [Williamwhitmania taraxaci]SDC03670.1 Chain length determinant protein [Williamwhitmania taraxaci]